MGRGAGIEVDFVLSISRAKGNRSNGLAAEEDFRWQLDQDLEKAALTAGVVQGAA